MCLQLRTTSTVAEDELLTSKKRAAEVNNKLQRSTTICQGQWRAIDVINEEQRSSTATEVTYELPRSARPNWPWTSYKGQQQAYEVNNKLQCSTTSYQVHKKSFYEICFEKILFLSDNHRYYWCKLLFIHIVILVTLIKNNQIRNINNLCMFDINYNYFLCRQYFNKHYQ